MSDFRILSPYAGGQPVTVTGTSQKWPLGLIVQAEDRNTASASNMGAGHFVYCIGASVSAPNRGDWVFYAGNSAKLLGSGSSLSNSPIGVAAGDLTASNVYGWVQVRGLCDYAKFENATIAVGASAFIASATNTDGQIASTQTATGNAVFGIFFPVSVASNTVAGASTMTGTAQLDFPRAFVGSNL
jgi:hypothetical protein